MSQPAPLPEAVALFNQLMRLSPEDTQSVGQVVWRLKAAVAKQPKDYAAKIALIQGYIFYGDASAANMLAVEIWPIREHLEKHLSDTYLHQLVSLGMYERFVEYDEHIGEREGIINREQRAEMRLTSAWCTGNLDDVKRYADLYCAFHPEFRSVWAKYFYQLEELGLDQHFYKHQKIVRAETNGLQLCSTYSVVDDVDAGIQASTFVFIHGSYAFRSELETKIYHHLSEYYSEFNLSVGQFWEILTPILLSSKSNPRYGHSKVAA